MWNVDYKNVSCHEREVFSGNVYNSFTASLQRFEAIQQASPAMHLIIYFSLSHFSFFSSKKEPPFFL